MIDDFFETDMYGPAVRQLLRQDVDPFSMQSMVNHLSKELKITNDNVFEMVGEMSVKIIQQTEDEGKDVDIDADDLVMLAIQTLCMNNAKWKAEGNPAENATEDDTFTPEEITEGVKYLNDQNVDPSKFTSMVSFLAKEDGSSFLEATETMVQTVKDMHPDVDMDTLPPSEYIDILMDGLRNLCFAFAMKNLGHIEVDTEDDTIGDITYDA